MKHITHWTIPLFFTAGLLLPAQALADYSKNFEGYRIFTRNCFICHGTDGKGHGPLASKLATQPADLTDNEHLSTLSDQELYRIIEGTAPHGQVSDAMPKWGLSLPGPQINSLVSYIRYMHRSKHRIFGNPLRGKQVYDNNCAICHGKDGKGHGILARVYDMKPADHTNAERMNSLSNESLKSVINNGSSNQTLMPAWKGILTDTEIDDVLSYIRLLSAP